MIRNHQLEYTHVIISNNGSRVHFAIHMGKAVIR